MPTMIIVRGFHVVRKDHNGRQIYGITVRFENGNQHVIEEEDIITMDHIDASAKAGLELTEHQWHAIKLAMVMSLLSTART